jgi:hypothetical protein
VRKAALWTLLGNHDEALFEEPVDFSRNAFRTVRHRRRRNDAETVGIFRARRTRHWKAILLIEAERIAAQRVFFDVGEYVVGKGQQLRNGAKTVRDGAAESRSASRPQSCRRLP